MFLGDGCCDKYSNDSGKAKYTIADGVAERTQAAADELLGNHPLYPGLEL